MDEIGKNGDRINVFIGEILLDFVAASSVRNLTLSLRAASPIQRAVHEKDRQPRLRLAIRIASTMFIEKKKKQNIDATFLEKNVE